MNAAVRRLMDRVDPAEVERQDREVREARAYEMRLKREGILLREGVALPPAMEAAVVSDSPALDGKKAARVVRKWLASDTAPRVLVLSGGTGSGKTVAAALALTSRESGCWREVDQFAKAMRAYGREAEADQAWLLRCPLLVVDDVGTEKGRDREEMAGYLRTLLEKRQGKRTRTVITTNLSEKAFHEVYNDERVASRADRRFGLVAWVTLEDADMRRATRA